jgi:hypothetical protein
MRFLLLTLLGCFAVGGTAAPGTCGPVLNEVMADPAGDWDGDGSYNYRDDEWVEIYNPGPGSLDLEGVLIGDGDATPLMALSGMLGAEEHRLVTGSEAYAFQQANGWSAYGLRLGNDGDTVTLLQIVDSDTLLIDSYTYLTHEADDDRSSGRNPDGSPTWELFDLLNPYTGAVPPLGNGLPPTPGSPNDGTPVAVEETTWGRVRVLYHE